MDKATKAGYLGIKHYYDNYNEPPVPPIWTVLEGVTITVLESADMELARVEE
jgi:hypothetical protein